MDSLEDFSNSFDSSLGIGTEEVHHDTILMVFRILACVFGLFGNLMVIFVILVLQEYKKAVTHWYVLQLAIADSIFLLTLPFKVVEDFHDEWIFTGAMCKAKETILFLNYYSSILFLMVMSIDRYIAVCHGFSNISQKLRTKRSAYIITVVVWVTSLLLCTPIMLYSDKRGIVGVSCRCQYEFPKPTQSPEEICQSEGFTSNTTMEDCIERRRDMQSESGCTELNLNKLFGILGSGSGDEEFVPDLISIGEDFGQIQQTTAASEIDGTGTEGIEGMEGPEPIVYSMGCSYAMNGRAWISYLTFNFVVMFILPFFIMSICYCLIALRLKQSRLRRASITNESMSNPSATGNTKKIERKRTRSAATTKAENNRIRVTCTCLILVLLFLVCWLPFHAVHLAKMKGIPGNNMTGYCSWIASVSSLIAYWNSALNPYIYNFIGTRFGKRLRDLLNGWKDSMRPGNRSKICSTTTFRPKYTGNVERRNKKTHKRGQQQDLLSYQSRNVHHPSRLEEEQFVTQIENRVVEEEVIRSATARL